MLHLLEIDVVNRRGMRASRARLFLRSAIFWTIVFIGIAGLTIIAIWTRPRAGVFFIGYGLVSLFTAERSLADRVAGTWLLPR